MGMLLLLLDFSLSFLSRKGKSTSYLPTSSIALGAHHPPVKLNWGMKTRKQLFRHKNRAVKARKDIFNITTREFFFYKDQFNLYQFISSRLFCLAMKREHIVGLGQFRGSWGSYVVWGSWDHLRGALAGILCSDIIILLSVQERRGHVQIW